MLKLRQLQTQFQEMVKHDVPVEKMPIYVAKGIDKETRMGIYRYAYWTRITDALADDFPKTDNLLLEWPFSFEDLVHDFMILEKNNVASLAELSKAFFLYVLSTNPRMNTLPIDKIKLFVKTLRTDYACLMAEFSPWSLHFDENTKGTLSPSDLAEKSDQARAIWNKSLQIFDTVLVFQKNRETQVVDLSETDFGFQNSLHTFFELLDSRRNINRFDELVNEMSRLKIDTEDSQNMIRFFVENEILFFTA